MGGGGKWLADIKNLQSKFEYDILLMVLPLTSRLENECLKPECLNKYTTIDWVWSDSSKSQIQIPMKHSHTFDQLYLMSSFLLVKHFVYFINRFACWSLLVLYFIDIISYVPILSNFWVKSSTDRLSGLNIGDPEYSWSQINSTN